MEPAVYVQQILFNDVAAALANRTSLSIVQANTPVHASFLNVSLFAQDTWRLAARLILTYGLRWDFNPAPTGKGSNGLAPFAVQGINNLPALSLAPAGSPLYRTTASNFAPRFGIAYELRHPTGTGSVIKAGVGIFYDSGNGPAGNAFSGFSFPFSGVRTLAGVPFPLSPSDAAPPSITPMPPFSSIVAFPAVLKIPYMETSSSEWEYV
jgi:outer membrane receptor protein involved in Fe transport